MNKMYPKTIYLEPTTRCNLRCRMCVKYAPGSRIKEMDLDPAVCVKMAPALAQARHLIINGIGEPLLHPQLETIISLAREHLPVDGNIAMQTNGVLIDEARTNALLRAGLDTICLSLDDLVDPPPSADSPSEHSFAAVSQAVAVLTAARKKTGAALRVGLETVIQRDNYRQLPNIVAWAGAGGVDFIVVTHLFHYVPSPGDIFNPNAAPAVTFFEHYQQQAAARNLDLLDCLNVYRTFDRSPASLASLDFLRAMHRDAVDQDIRLHLASLIERHREIDSESILAVFNQAQQQARAIGLELSLPPLVAPPQRSCRFIEEQATCIAVDGEVMPCHFLWHAYNCLVMGQEVAVESRSFGSLRHQDLLEIWRNDAYRHFRREAGAYDYAPCWNCPQGPCPDLVNDTAAYANDCYGSAVPCGHCQWSLGGIRCL